MHDLRLQLSYSILVHNNLSKGDKGRKTEHTRDNYRFNLSNWAN